MIDLNSKSQNSDKINFYIDQALEIEQGLQPGRNYLGGSRLGHECERALQYEFTKTPKDPERHFSGRVLRIFARGHWIESAMILWLRNAGFGLIEGLKDGGQFGFVAHDGKVKGHNDGVIVSGPFEFGPWPRLWENKGIAEKGFKALVKKKLRTEYPVYYAQIQYYQKHFNLTENPALFSAVNMNTMEIYWEDVPFDPNFADQLDAKAARILRACEARELLPRAYQDKSFYKCKWCDYSGRCWG